MPGGLYIFRFVFTKAAGSKNRRPVLLCCAAAMLPLVASTSLAATQNTWTSSTSGNWSNGANWQGGVAPAISPTGDANLEFNAPGTYTANNDLGPFGVYNTTFDAGNGTTTLTGGDINLSWPLSEGNNPTFTDNSTNPVIINNNVNFTAPAGVGGTAEYFVFQPGATTTINGVVSLTGGSDFKMTNGQQNPGDATHTGGPGGTLIWTQPVNFTNSPLDGFSGQFDFRVYEGTFEMGGYTISDGFSNGSGVHNFDGVNVLYGDGVKNGAVTNMFIGPEDALNGHPNDVASLFLIAAGNSFNTRVQIGGVGPGGAITIGGKNTSGVVTFNDFFLTLPSNGNGIVNGLSQTIYYSAAAGGTVLQNFQLIRGGGSGFCGASINKVGPGTWIIAAGGTNATGEQAYHGTTTVRDGTLELAYDDTGTNFVTLPASAISAEATQSGSSNYASGLDGGSLGFNAPTDPNPALDTNAVQLGDSGTLSTDNIALLTLNNSGAPGPRTVLHNISVNANNSTGTTTLGVADNGTANFTGNILLKKNVVLTGGAGGVANFGDPVAGTGGIISGTGGVTVNGTGTVNLIAVNTYNGPTAINQGTLTVATTGSIANTAITVGNGVTSGTLTFAANTSSTLARNVASLNVTTTGVVTIPAGAGKTVLIVNGSYANTGKIDLFNNDMIAKGAGASGLTAITAQIKSGLNLGGSIWQGATGIESTTAAADHKHITAIGVIQNIGSGGVQLYGAGGSIAGSFDGQTSLGVNDILVKYTYFGDANLDGRINGSDYNQIDGGFSSGGTKKGWVNGDFNYDGVIDGSDYTLIDNAFNTQGAQIASARLSAATASDIATSATAVPEPTTLGLISIGAISLFGRRRKRSMQ